MKRRLAQKLLAIPFLAAAVTACTSVPGETLVPRRQLSDVRDRVLAVARNADPQCKRHEIIHTEILDVRGDGRPAEELWTVNQCGRRVNYVVSFPTRPGAGFAVLPER